MLRALLALVTAARGRAEVGFRAILVLFARGASRQRLIFLAALSRSVAWRFWRSTRALAVDSVVVEMARIAGCARTAGMPMCMVVVAVAKHAFRARGMIRARERAACKCRLNKERARECPPHV